MEGARLPLDPDDPFRAEAVTSFRGKQIPVIRCVCLEMGNAVGSG